jgi:hypothetical protein
VYVPSLKNLFFSHPATQMGILSQLVVELNNNPPTLSEFISDPLEYAANGGTVSTTV